MGLSTFPGLQLCSMFPLHQQQNANDYVSVKVSAIFKFLQCICMITVGETGFRSSSKMCYQMYLYLLTSHLSNTYTQIILRSQTCF